MGEAYFPRDVPPDVADRVIANFINGSRDRGGIDQNQDQREDEIIAKYGGGVTGVVPPPPPGFTVVGNVGNAWRFTVQKKFDGLRSIGLGALVMGVSAVVIQGMISIVAWIIRGFRS